MSCATTFGLIIGGVILLGFAIKKYLGRNQDYWKKRGIAVIKKPYSGWKALYYILTKKKNAVEFDVDIYNALGSERFGGTVDFGLPSLLLKDPELIKQVLVKDFDHFVDRRKLSLASEKMLNSMLTALEGQEWKTTRSCVSPTFTTGKIRRMFEHFNNCGSDLVNFVKTKPVGSPGTRDIVVKEAISRYLIDIIGATAFGMEANSLKDADSMFYKMAKRSSEFSFVKLLRAIAAMAFPFLTKLGVRFTDPVSMDFFENIVRSALRNRESSNEKREDFLQLMIEARRGELKTDESELDTFEKEAQLKKAEGVGDSLVKAKITLTDDVILAQSLLFFIAGLETTGSVLCFAVYILALHQDIQAKLYEEVSEAIKAKGGDIDYDGINKLEYLEKIIAELLRMYPPGTRIERRCTKDYTISGTNAVVGKDALVYIPVLAVHRDPQYYPDPDRFDPERFTPEAKAARHPYTYIPFGHGPRNCIGMRFALMEAKVALAYLVSNFLIEPCESTPIPVKPDPFFGVRPEVSLELRFKERNTLNAEE